VEAMRSKQVAAKRARGKILWTLGAAFGSLCTAWSLCVGPLGLVTQHPFVSPCWKCLYSLSLQISFLHKAETHIRIIALGHLQRGYPNSHAAFELVHTDMPIGRARSSSATKTGRLV
jgi:6-phosphofructokinase